MAVQSVSHANAASSAAPAQAASFAQAKTAAKAQAAAPAKAPPAPAKAPAAPAKPAAPQKAPVATVATRVGAGAGQAPNGQKFAATYQNVTVTPKKPLLNLNESGSLNLTGNMNVRNVQAQTNLNGKTADAGYRAVGANLQLNSKLSDKTTAFVGAGGELTYVNLSNGKTGPMGADKSFAHVSVGVNHKTPLTEKTTLDLGVRLRETQARNYNTGATTSTDRLALTAKGTHKVNDKTTASIGLFGERQHNKATGENRNILSVNPEVSRKLGGGTLSIGAEVGLDKTNKFDGDTSFGSKGSNVYAQWSFEF